MIEFKFGDKYVDTKIISVRQAELNEFKQHIKTVDGLIFDGKLREVLGGDEN